MPSVPTPALLAHASAIDLHKREVVAAGNYAVLTGIFYTTSYAFVEVLTMLYCTLKFLCATAAKLRRSLPAWQAASCNMRSHPGNGAGALSPQRTW